LTKITGRPFSADWRATDWATAPGRQVAARRAEGVDEERGAVRVDQAAEDPGAVAQVGERLEAGVRDHRHVDVLQKRVHPYRGARQGLLQGLDLPVLQRLHLDAVDLAEVVGVGLGGATDLACHDDAAVGEHRLVGSCEVVLDLLGLPEGLGQLHLFQVLRLLLLLHVRHDPALRPAGSGPRQVRRLQLGADGDDVRRVAGQADRLHRPLRVRGFQDRLVEAHHGGHLQLTETVHAKPGGRLLEDRVRAAPEVVPGLQVVQFLAGGWPRVPPLEDGLEEFDVLAVELQVRHVLGDGLLDQFRERLELRRAARVPIRPGRLVHQ
jgi:hypothetical protein